MIGHPERQTVRRPQLTFQPPAAARSKAHLSGYVRAVKKGETLLVVERGTPVARMVPAGDTRGGVVTRPPTRDLASVKQMLKRLPPLDCPADSLAILLEDRKR